MHIAILSSILSKIYSQIKIQLFILQLHHLLMYCEEFSIQILAFYQEAATNTFYTAICIYIPVKMD